ncbi:membrane protein [Candidatus Nanosynbacter lyticus]|uniref:Membrane protein n=1 Tax=Candidatus Nanosynbacter lyticus TaxID=2093824 RepID=A0A6S4GP86_9BACT|nr:divergent PAP2 family protein [Candidatus Nanosynbacter lyticus]AJA06325.1 membrane protein [Candidatus Nanosynbacter lyticus]QCT41286.1 divergent PAP2 family protein [TM7 phylum sp. oral taxon 952]
MKVLVVPVIAWVISQGLKQVFHLMGRNRRVFSGDTNPKILLSGGMPSAHSAIVVSMAVFLGLQDGLNSSVFGLSVWLSIIVMYDAMMVRYSSGMQGEALNRLIVEQGSKLKKLRVAHGHTPVEVLAGALIGAVVAIVVFFATK